MNKEKLTGIVIGAFILILFIVGIGISRGNDENNKYLDSELTLQQTINEKKETIKEIPSFIENTIYRLAPDWNTRIHLLDYSYTPPARYSLKDFTVEICNRDIIMSASNFKTLYHNILSVQCYEIDVPDQLSKIRAAVIKTDKGEVHIYQNGGSQDFYVSSERYIIGMPYPMIKQL